MISAGAVVGLIFAVFFAVVAVALAVLLLRLTKVVGETERLVQGITDKTVPLLGEVTTSVVQVNGQLARVDAITANVQSVSGNVSALTALFAATLGSPVIKVAAFSYGVRRTLTNRREADVAKRVKAEVKAERAAARSSRRRGGR